MDRRGFLGALSGSLLLTGCHGVTFRGDPTTRISGTIPGRDWGGPDADWMATAPARAVPRGLIIGLHGKGGNAASSFDLGLPTHALRAGFAFASVSGGNGYWHARRDGSDPGELVLSQLIPAAIAGTGASTSTPIGLIGWSMGGYGSLLLAGSIPRNRLLGVATMSAALWTEPGAAAPGAFDDVDDYRAHDVFAPKRLLPDARVSMACGLSDPFIASNKAYVSARPATSQHWDAGGHTEDYWSAHAGPLIDFLTTSPLVAPPKAS